MYRETASNLHNDHSLLQDADFSSNQIEEIGDLSGHRALRNLNLSRILPCSVMQADPFIFVEGQWNTYNIIYTGRRQLSVQVQRFMPSSLGSIGQSVEGGGTVNQSQ